MKTFIIIIAMFLFNGNTEPDGVISWINENAKEIKSLEMDAPKEDLNNLQSFLSSKKVIALGESTHGSHEFFQVKSRLIKYLVTELDFRILAFESNFTESFSINEYILEGKGDPKDALKSIYFWTWQTEEIVELLVWLKNYNMTVPHEKRIMFYGIDFQYISVSVDNIYNYISTNNPNLFIEYSSLLNELKQADWLDNQDRKKYKDLYNRFYQSFKTVNSSKISRELERQIELVNLYLSGSIIRRDRLMADNVKWLNDTFQKKIIVWAANDHIKKSAPNYHPMGLFLNEYFSDEYYSIMLDFYKGKFRAYGPEKIVKEYTIDNSKKKSTGYIFSKANYPHFFLDFKSSLADQDMALFLTSKIESRGIGGAFGYRSESRYYRKNVLKDTYDGVIFINQITSSIPIKY